MQAENKRQLFGATAFTSKRSLFFARMLMRGLIKFFTRFRNDDLNVKSSAASYRIRYSSRYICKQMQQFFYPTYKYFVYFDINILFVCGYFIFVDFSLEYSFTLFFNISVTFGNIIVRYWPMDLQFLMYFFPVLVSKRYNITDFEIQKLLEANKTISLLCIFEKLSKRLLN